MGWKLDKATIADLKAKGMLPADYVPVRAKGHRMNHELQFQKTVTAFAHLNGWKVASFRPARVLRHGQETYETPVSADGAGFPDLVLVHRRRGLLVVAELKIGKNRPTPKQRDWLQCFTAAGISAYVWKPQDWPEIQRVLGNF
jgi:hypothetical protein